MTTVEIEAKLLDLSELLHEWFDRYERAGVPRQKLLFQFRTVLTNMEMQNGIDREKTVEAAAVEAERKRCLEMIGRCRVVYERLRQGAIERDGGNNPGFQPTVSAHDCLQKMTAIDYVVFVVGDWSVGDKFKKDRMPMPF